MELSRPSCYCHLAGKRVVVAGAGLAGLAFAISLKTLWSEELGKFPEVVFYEREYEEHDLNRDGHTISIRSSAWNQGIQVLQRMNMLDAVLKTSMTREGNERGYFGLWSLDWRRLISVRESSPLGTPTPGLRITRTKLRRILLKAMLEFGSIRWGVACTAVSRNKDNSIKLRLSTGKEDSCDLLVVADGANSKIRASVRPDDNLQFAGPVSIAGVSRFQSLPPIPVCRDWGTIPNGQGVALFFSPMDDRSANWSVSYMAEKPRKEQRQPLSPDACTELLEEAKKRGSAFGETFQTLLDHSDSASLMVFNSMDKEPFAHGGVNGVPDGIVFIGDSNHAVSQWAGNGANLALRDGFDLAECLCSHRSFEEAVQVYDKRSIRRARTSVRNSHVTIAVAHSSGLAWRILHSLLLLLGVVMSEWYKLKDALGAI